MGWGISKKTISNNLTNLVRGKTPRLKRLGTPSGTYRVNDYWLRITRGTQAEELRMKFVWRISVCAYSPAYKFLTKAIKVSFGSRFKPVLLVP